jgi:hypothetical protein
MEAMTWHNLISGFYEVRKHVPGTASKPKFCLPASSGEIADAQEKLCAKLPTCLSSLLLEANGVMDLLSIDGGDWIENMWLIWPLGEMVERNIAFRGEAAMGTYVRDFRQFAFFADAGCDGILFGFPMIGSRDCGSSVVSWHPIEDEVTSVAASLEEFLGGWLAGAIVV